MNDKSPWLPVLREGVAGVIAIIFVVTFLLLVRAAYTDMQVPARFGPAKELLGIVNGIVGIIIGYYFSRMTTEARAEKAEQTAEKATDAAGTATHKEREAKAELSKVTIAAKEVLPTNPSGGGVRSAIGGGASVSTPDPAAMARLAAAVSDAERVLSR